MPVIMVVDDDAELLDVFCAELSKRYAADYRIAAHTSPEAALDELRRLRVGGEPVAVLIADLWLGSTTGIDFLNAAHQIHPTAKRALLRDFADHSSLSPMVDAFALGQLDCHVERPVHSPDEDLHAIVTELLADWARAHGSTREAVKVIGEHWSPRSHEARDLLSRYGVPSRFYPSDSDEGRAMLDQVGVDDPSAMVLVLADGRALVNPTNAEAADAMSVTADLSDNRFDVVVVGAGPAGLAAAVYAASEGLRTLVVEREAVGGQAGTTSRIRNYLGFPRGITGSALAAHGFQQAFHFGASFHLMREVTRLEPGSPHHRLRFSDGAEALARTVVVATGVTYRRLDLASLDRLVGRGVYYGPAVSEAPAMTGQHVFVVGGGNSAGQAAVHLARYAAGVTVLVRGESLAASMSEYLVREIDATDQIEVRFCTEVVAGSGQHRLEDVVVRNSRTGATDTLPAGGLFVLIGAEPRTGWLPPDVARDGQGYLLAGADLGDGSGAERALLETSVPGVFVAGDVRHRSIKRVASAAGEGAMVVAQIHEHLALGERAATR